jgi:hypothetical protein
VVTAPVAPWCRCRRPLSVAALALYDADASREIPSFADHRSTWEGAPGRKTASPCRVGPDSSLR